MFNSNQFRQVPWQDLIGLSRFEVAKELLLPLPWLAVSLLLASRGQYLAAVPVSVWFFLAGLRQIHDACHYNLGISRRATEWVLGALSVMMLGSSHAVQFNHLRHHGHCMKEEDVEARSARMEWWRAILWGPIFPILTHRTALRLGRPRERRWVRWELAGNVLWVVLVFGVLRWPVLEYHAAAMAVGHCFTAFFAVWTVHHDAEDAPYPARTIRNRFKRMIVLNMFFHAEHHLFPKVPTCHLPELARRLDRTLPELRLKRVY
jgi:fatty acid desaturase